MLNTCSIGRRWKPREGWSRPVLTGERGTLSDPLVGSGLVLWWFLVGWQGMLFLVVTRRKIEAFLFASVVRFPDRHDRNRGWFRCRPPVLPVGRCIGFAVVMAQVRRPVPFRTRKLRPGRGDGTALERVWESSTPPHSHVGPSGRVPWGIPGRSFLFRMGVPVGRNAPGTPIFYAFFRCSLPVACGRLPFHNTPRITWSASVTVINDVMRLTRYVRAGSRESRYDGKRQKPDN